MHPRRRMRQRRVDPPGRQRAGAPPVTTAGPPPSTLTGQTLPSTVPPTIATTTTTPLGHPPAVPGRRPRRRHVAGGDHVLARTRFDTGDDAHRPHRGVQRQPGPGPRHPREPGWLQPDDRQVRPEPAAQPTRDGDVPRVHGPADRRLRLGDPDRSLHRGERVRHVAVPSQDAARLRDRGRPVVDAVQRQRPGPLLQPQGVRGGGSRSGGLPGVARGAAGDLPDDRRHGRGGDGDRARLGRRLRGRVVPRAVVRAGRRAVCRQRQRPAGTGDRSAVRRTRSASR